jgi:predicted DNA-binding transcriptional regulator AlpA
MPQADPPIAPRFLREHQAAAYLGVPVAVFRREVAAGTWPQPVRRGARAGASRGGVLTWDRKMLDAVADAMASLPDQAPAPSRDPARRAMFAAALDAASRG